MGANVIRTRLYINKDIYKQIKEISKRGKQYMKDPYIEFMDFDDEKQLINYILKLGLIKFAEVQKWKLNYKQFITSWL